MWVDQTWTFPYHQDLWSRPDHISDGKSNPLHTCRLSCSTSKGQAFQKRSLGAAPRKHSTNHMYDDRLLLFSAWASEQGIDPHSQSSSLFPILPLADPRPQMHNGYWSCLASVLSCSGKGQVVHDRIILGMISFMK